ncbi:MAG: TRAP transporter small permease [Candidatus Competibacterales bacterium]|nr:TRAP transporter small permease [Candidatus Competibacterales bacterium]
MTQNAKPHGWLKPLTLLDRGIARVEIWILAWGVILMALNSISNVIGRFVFSRSLYFSPELNQFLIVLITFVGLGYAARQGRHIRMSAIYDQLPDIGKKILMIIIAAATGTVMFALAWYSYLYVERLAKLGTVTPSLQVPLYLTYLWVPLGFVITGIQYWLTVVRNLTSREVYISWEHVDMYDESELTGT